MQVKIINDYPPQWEKIKAAFPGAVASRSVLITIGNVIYNPFNVEMRDDLIEHEKVHMRQQDQYNLNPDQWIEEYLNNPKFRLSVEIEAYREHLKFLHRKIVGKTFKKAIKHYARALSSTVYGNVCSYEFALEQLRLPFK